VRSSPSRGCKNRGGNETQKKEVGFAIATALTLIVAASAAAQAATVDSESLRDPPRTVLISDESPIADAGFTMASS